MSAAERDAGHHAFRRRQNTEDQSGLASNARDS
jgi:hypothetical protein